MTAPVDYGVLFNDQSDDLQPMQTTDMSTIFLIGSSDDATPSFLPLNGTRMYNSSDPLFLANLGTGALATAVQLINAQLGDRQLAARIIVDRIAKGASDAETMVNIVGSQAAGSGIYASLRAGQIHTVTPRLFCFADGLTGRFTRSSGTTTVTRTAKFGGNTGTGLLTLAATPYGNGVKPGVYQVRCMGGTLAVTAAAKAGGNTGTGTVGTLTVDADAPIGTWRVTCGAAAVNGGSFAVQRPDGTLDGIATVGAAYSSAHGPNFTIADGVTDFVVGDSFDLAVVSAVPANGGVFSVTDPDGIALPAASVGAAYVNVVAFTVADGATDFAVGDGFDVTVSVVGGEANANPICAALPAVLNALQAVAIVDGPGTTVQDDLDWRETLSSKRLIPVSTFVTPVGFADGTYCGPGPVVAGIGVRVDAQTRGFAGVPSQSFANQEIAGITALKRYDSFSISDGANDGQLLLSNNIGIIERGQAGVDSAASASGFVLICYATAGTGLDRFFNVNRTQDYAELQVQKAWRARLGKSNITRHDIQAFENDADAVLSALKTDEHIIDFRNGIGAGNTPETIRAGRFRFKIQQEPASPFLVAEADVYRYRDALNSLLADVAGTTNAALSTA